MADQSPEGIAKLLAGLNSAFSDPNNAGTMGFAQGLLQASGKHAMVPITMGQALGMGSQASQEFQKQSLENTLARTATVPFQQARTKLFQAALNSTDPNMRAIALQLGGVDPNRVPQSVQELTAARNKETPATPGQGGTEFDAAHQNIPVRGPTPPGAVQNASTGAVSAAPGAIPFNAAMEDLKQGILARYTPGMPIQDPKTGLARFAPLSSELGSPRSITDLIGRATATAQGQPQVSPPQPTAQPAPTQQPPARQMPQGPGAPVVGLGPSTTAAMTTNQTAATQRLTQAITEGRDAQQQVANLEELNNAASRITTGPGTEGRIAVQKALASLGGVFGKDAEQLGSITDSQIFNKTAINFTLQAVSSAGQHAYNAMETVLNAVPSLKNTNLANSVVTGALLATARYKAALGEFSSKWQQENNGMGFVPNKGSSDGAWAKQAPFMAYFMSSLPPQVQGELIKAAAGNATLRSELSKARNSVPWLKENGYL